MAQKNVFNKLIFLLMLSVISSHDQISNNSMEFRWNDAHIRYAIFRCFQQFPLADIVNYSDTSETHCFLHCLLYKTGLMDLTTRGLNSQKIREIWKKSEIIKVDSCLENFDLNESLSGTCSDSYRKLMEFRNKCWKLFEYTFTAFRAWEKKDNSKYSKGVGVSATEFCDSIKEEEIAAKESFKDEEVAILTQYKNKLNCIFENIHYLDAYGRVDESEINLSYQEAQADTLETRDIIKNCAHQANSKFQEGYLGNLVLELQKCLKHHSPVFEEVFRMRDENSRHY